MNAYRTLAALSLVLGSVALAACSDYSDSRTQKLAPGMDRQNALAALAAGAAPESAKVASPYAGDSLTNIWRRTSYLLAGRNIEVLWYSPKNEKWKATDTVPEDKVIPVVLIDGKVIGAGRTVYDSVAKFYAIPRNKY